MEEIAREYIKSARQLSTRGSYSKSYDLYLTAFDTCPELKTSLEPEFRVVMNRLNEVLVSTNKMEDIFINFVRTLETFPDNVYFLNEIGKYLFKYAFYDEAWSYFHKALHLDSGFVDAEKNLNSVKNFLVERWHYRMLNDKVRNETYRAAIHQILIPNKDSVLDIGTGTGLLSMYASECKPAMTTACESSAIMAKLADVITQEHGYELIVIINKMSTALNYRDIGGKRSLLVTELFDAGLFGEHVLQTLSHAWEYLLNSVARVIPNKVEFFVTGVNCDFLARKYQLCSVIKTLLNVSELNVHVVTHDETYDCEDVHLYSDDLKYLTDPTSVVAVDFNKPQEIQEALERTKPYEIKLKAIEDGEINAYIGWFNIYLTDKITLTTDPRSNQRANAWQQAIFFDNIPKLVKENDIVDAEFLLNGGKWTMLPEYDYTVTRISLGTLRFLNDIDYMNMISACIGMASVYLGQMADMSQVNVIDLCPFPMFGLQLLKRGIESLICYARTESDKCFFKKVFNANNIPLSKVTILMGDNCSTDVFRDEKYHAIFCNFFDICGEIDQNFKELSQNLKENNLVRGGLFLPASVKLVGQVVNSPWLDINNRIFNENVSNFNIERYLTKFQVTQNYYIDLNHLEYTPLSEPMNLGAITSPLESEMIHTPVIKDGYVSAILCWYVIELMDNLKEISTNRKFSFIDGVAFIDYTRTKLRSGMSTIIVRYVDSNGSFKLCLKDIS